MGKRLNFLRQLFERDQRGRERLRHHPLVMAGNAFLRHRAASCRICTGQLTAISGVWEKLEAVATCFGTVIQELLSSSETCVGATGMATASARSKQLTQRPQFLGGGFHERPYLLLVAADNDARGKGE